MSGICYNAIIKTNIRTVMRVFVLEIVSPCVAVGVKSAVFPWGEYERRDIWN